MNALVVLFSVLAYAAAKPSIVPLAYSSYVHAPAAVSHQSRVDIRGAHGLAYAAPAYGYGAPAIGYAAPAIAYGAPALGLSHAPLSLAPHAPAVVLNAHGVPLDTPEVVAARAQHYQAKSLASHGVHLLRKRSIAPLAYLAGPSAVSHQSRVDLHSTPALAYTAPALSYAAPALRYAAPAYGYSALGYASPALGYSAPLHYSAAAYGVHPW